MAGRMHYKEGASEADSSAEASKIEGRERTFLSLLSGGL